MTLISYYAGIMLEKTNSKKSLYSGSLFIIISVLFVFKYLNFVFAFLNQLISAFTLRFDKLLLPVGISFYVFEIISYLTDVYKGVINPEKDFINYSLYLSLFPTVTSGPIERAGNILPQLKNDKQFDYDQASYGVKLFALGLFKKIVVGDNLAFFVNRIYDNPTEYQGFVLLFATILYAIEIYADFSGYSDMARGLASLLGISINRNFKVPYLSTSLKEFWSKWHISLTSWLRDYVYIPIGGNRCSKIRKYINVLITFLISGIWHGANITFIIWGLLHGLMQIIEDVLGIHKTEKKHTFIWFMRLACLFAVLSFTWIFFRANNLHDAFYIIRNMFIGINNPRTYLTSISVAYDMGFKDIIKKLLICVLPLILIDLIDSDSDVTEKVTALKPFIRYALYIFFVLYILFFHNIGEISFVYFKF